MTPEQLAQRFHEAYERLAPQFGYKTREASAVPWASVPDQNKRLMIAVAEEVQAIPIDMVLFCPKCGEQHIDAPSGRWTNPPHKSHLCETCGHIWRPADQPTYGVASIQTAGVADSKPVKPYTWRPISEYKPEYGAVVTHRTGERDFNMCHVITDEDGQIMEWVETQTGVTTVTHSTFAEPTHFMRVRMP